MFESDKDITTTNGDEAEEDIYNDATDCRLRGDDSEVSSAFENHHGSTLVSVKDVKYEMKSS